MISSPSILKAVSRKLMAFGRLVPLRPGTKRPWLLKVIEGATNNPETLLEWQRTKPNADYGIRLWSDDIIVLDFERPGKGSVLGGLHTLSGLEAGHDPIPTTGPRSANETGGEHWFFLLPFEFHGRMKNWNHVFAGVDIRVRTGLIVIPPTVGRRWITTFDEAELPILPEWFCHLILLDHKEAKTTTSDERVRSNSTEQLSYLFNKECDIAQPDFQDGTTIADAITFEPTPISEKEMYSLKLSKDFKPLWNKMSPYRKDQSNSCYEYYLCRMGLSYGLSKDQVMTLIQLWWSHHHIKGKIDRLVRYTLPNAWEQVKDRVEAYQATQEAKKQANANSKTVNRIISYLLQHESASPAQMKTDLELSHSTVQMQLKRMATKGLIERVGRGRYRVVVEDETDDVAAAARGDTLTDVRRSDKLNCVPPVVNDPYSLADAVTASPHVNRQGP